MDMMDTNHDGKVSWDEYSAVMKDSQEDWEEQQHKVKQHFEYADVDNSGDVSQEEMTALIKNMDIGYLKHAVKAIMKLGDTETVDGKLSLNEIIKHHGEFGVNLDIFMSDPELLFVKGVGNQMHNMNNRFVERASNRGIDKHLLADPKKDAYLRGSLKVDKKAGGVYDNWIEKSPLLAHLKAP
jgi:hypothetical protein